MTDSMMNSITHASPNVIYRSILDLQCCWCSNSWCFVLLLYKPLIQVGNLWTTRTSLTSQHCTTEGFLNVTPSLIRKIKQKKKGGRSKRRRRRASLQHRKLKKKNIESALLALIFFHNSFCRPLGCMQMMRRDSCSEFCLEVYHNSFCFITDLKRTLHACRPYKKLNLQAWDHSEKTE